MAKMRISPELKKLIEKYRCVKDTEGMSPAIRTQFGSDINAACGQLAGAYRDDQKQGERTMSARDVKSFGEEVEASC